METTEYITPSPSSPVFMAYNTAIGYISSKTTYKDWLIEDINHVGHTFAIYYSNAINYLHDFIKSEDGQFLINEYPKSKFVIEAIDGGYNKYQDMNYKKVYSITAKKAKQYLL